MIQRTVLTGLGMLMVLLGGTVIYLLIPPPGFAPRHEAIDPAPVFADPDMSFTRYIEAARAHIRAATAHLPNPPDETTVLRRGPNEYATDPAACETGPDGLPDRGVLLVHGLFDSPWSMHDMAVEFAENCYLARTILLPGHGTTPGHLSQATLEDWLRAYKYGLESFRDQIDGELVVVGFSMGVALAVLYDLHHGADADYPVSTIVGMAPALTGPLGIAWPARQAAGLSRDFPRLRFNGVGPGLHPVKYDSFPLAAYMEFARLQDAIGPLDAGRPLAVPAIFIQGTADQTVPPDNPLTFFCERVRVGLFLLYGGRTGRPCGRVAGLPQGWPEDGVLEVTHIGITSRPDNPVLGRVPGAHIPCLHYYGNDPENFATCRDESLDLQANGIRYGENSEENLRNFILRRASFHPGFDAMMERIFRYLDEGQK